MKCFFFKNINLPIGVDQDSVLNILFGFKIKRKQLRKSIIFKIGFSICKFKKGLSLHIFLFLWTIII